MDGDGAHHNGGDRVRRAVAGLGHGAAGVGGRAALPAALRRHHLLHLRPPRRLLPRGRPRHRQAQLHLHGGRPGLPRRVARLVLRLLPVRQHVRHRHRLHHHRLHQRRRREEVQLLPPARAQGGLQPVPERLHHRLRGGAGHLLPGAQLPQALVALHRRRHHVLLLRHYRGRPLAGADHHGAHGEDVADRHGGRDRRRRLAEGLDDVPGPRQRRLRLLLLHNPHRDPGHAAVTSGREQDDAEGDAAGHLDDDGLLHAVRLPGLLGVRQRRQRQHPDGVRLLRALLAGGLRQCVHRGPPGGRVPGVLPAAVRGGGGRCGAEVPGAGAGARGGVPAGVADGVRGAHHAAGHADALLQQHPGVPGQHRLLAAHRLLPRGDVHPAAADPAVRHQVDGAEEPQLRLLPRHHRRLRRLHPGRPRLAQDLHAVQHQVVKACMLVSVCLSVSLSRTVFIFLAL